MVDPKTSLALDAPPLAPYDDGFSTESEDLEGPDESQDMELRITVSAAVRRAAVGENRSKVQQLPIRVPSAEKTVKQEKEKTLQCNSQSIVKSKECASDGAIVGLQAPRNGGVTAGEEHCRSCRGYLTPLAERLKMMRVAASQYRGESPPLSKQCSCCHITYPLVALTDESRRQSWPEPRCYMCYWAVRAAKKTVGASMSSVKREENGSVEKTVAGSRDEREECCRGCKAKLTPLQQRLERMKEAVLLQKGNRPPASRQCACCWITYPMAALSTKSRVDRYGTPVCVICELATGSTEAIAPTASNLNQGKTPVAKKTVEIIEVDDDDEEGELLEEKECKCCRGHLIPLSKRAQMMKDAARDHGGKDPPPSRRCACCRITYPSAALTAKSRKMTRVVPICLSCCKAGGSAIYEMLAVSDEFAEAFKVENPVMARQLLAKKENGSLARQVKRHRERMKAAQPVKKEKGGTEVEPSQQRGFAPSAVYMPRPLMTRKVISAPRALLGQGMSGTVAVSRTHVHTGPGVRYFLRPPIMIRKSRNTPRQLLEQVAPAVPRTGEQANAGADASSTSQPNSQVISRSSRWLQQFELIDGKTARERRLEKRNETKEHRLEKKRQRME